MEMRLNKGHSKTINYRTFLYGSLLLFLGLINPGIPEVRSNVCPENLIPKIYPVDFYKVNFSDFRNFNVKRDIPAAPLTNKYPANNARSQSPSDQCYYYEGHRSFADRGPETAILAFSGIFFSYPLKPISLISHLSFVTFFSWTGNSIKIRPPPIS
jgi:hypothetical protein